MSLIIETLDVSSEQSKLSVTRALYRILVGSRDEVRRMKLDEMDVRLVSDERGSLWVNTGDVQYDTHHGAACASCEVQLNSSNDELWGNAESMVSDVFDQLYEIDGINAGRQLP